MKERLVGWMAVAASVASLLGGATSALAAEGVGAVSNVRGIAITRLSDLPAAPAMSGDAGFCGHLTIKPVSRGGAIAASLGWSVTGEVMMGGLSVVSFVGGFRRGTSGSCLLTDGNVGFFAGARLVAVAYASSVSSSMVGGIVALGGAGARIWNGDYLSQPVADVRLGDDGTIAILPLSAEEAFCQGRSVVPNVYGMPIADARLRLAGHGWTPASQTSGEASGLENCSGTGFGYCSFAYRSTGAALSVITAGEARAVSGYSVDCSPTVR